MGTPPAHPPAQPDVSLRLLEIFAAMMRCSTTIEAAEFLGISQPAVSAGLKQLENQLGLTLFQRSGRRLVPTAEATGLFEEISPLFGMLRSFSTRAHYMRTGRMGRLRIISTPPLGYSVGPRALRCFLEGRPEVKVSYDVGRLDTVVEAIKTGQADVGLVLNAERLDTVNTEVIQRGQMMVLLPEADPLARQPFLSPEMLAGRPLIGIEQTSQLGRLIAKGFEVAGAPYTPRMEVRLCQTAAAMVAEGLGITVTDPYSAQPYLNRGLAMVPMMPAQEIRASALTRKGVPHSGLLLAFITTVRDAILDSGFRDHGRGAYGS